MSPLVQSTLIPAAVGAVSAIVVAVFNHLLSKRKRTAEIEKLQADAELTRAQARQITDSLNNLSNKLTYRLPDVPDNSEVILYRSDHSDLFDFRINKIDGAEGELTVKEGVLSLTRMNTAGTVQVWLENYAYAGKFHLKMLPKNESLPGERRLRVSCEVKAVGGEHTLLFILKSENAPGGVHMAEKRHRVASNDWVAVDAYFRVSPGENCRLRIDDRSVSSARSSVQIRKLLVAERITPAGVGDGRDATG